MSVTMRDGRAVASFTKYDLDAYTLFLRAKKLPEVRLAYDWRTDAYELSAPARFAAALGIEAAPVVSRALPIAGHLFDYQRFVLDRALDAKRYAAWVDTGLGKTAIFLEWARQVEAATGSRVLILSPLGIVEQTRAEHRLFYGFDGVERIDTRVALEAWCAVDGPGVAICNYEKLIAGQMPELRNLAGLALDESSILKSGGGTIKWNLIHSAKGIEYKLSCTATPAPNDTMEYASQAAFLEMLRSEGEILWTYFTRDNKTNAWTVKPHAREAFYGFMASWSIYLRDPAAYGFADVLATLPPPEIHEHELPISEEQRAAMSELLADRGRGLFDERLGVKERSKLSQLAKGFVYVDGKAQPVESAKPAKVAELALAEVRQGRQTIVWTVFDAESAILAARPELRGLRVGTLHGDDGQPEREETIRRFKAGDLDVLITKAQLVGYGLNFQNCRAMIFSGFDDSFERMYQAIRRAYRFGQRETVHVHVPVIPELEGLMLTNLRRKEELFMRDVAECERHYVGALREELPRERRRDPLPEPTMERTTGTRG